MKTVPVGKEDFKKLIESGSYYVDKTKMIEELRENNVEVVLFPRPRRFGKTLTMSMIENFFEITKKEENIDLFKGLYIENSPYYKERGEYPVISISFKDINGGSFDDVFQLYKQKISDLYLSKMYVYDSLDDAEKMFFDTIRFKNGDLADYKFSIYNLTGYLARYHHKKVIVLIDEYDIPIQDGYLKGYYDDIVDLIRGIFLSALKTNDNLLFGVLTGVLRVSKESLFSGFNNVEVLGIMNSYFGEYFGFNEDETKELLEYYDLELTSDVKEMYDGYNFNNVEVYNPWSILNYAKKKVLSSYWVNTSGNSLIKKVIYNTNDENKQIINNLVQDQVYEFIYNENLTYKDFDDYNNIGNLFNLLFSSGYLTFDHEEEDEFGKRYFLRIPNREVIDVYKKIMTESIYGSDSSPNIRLVAEAISKYDMEKLEVVLNKMLINNSYMDSKEMYYHGFMTGIFSLYLNNDNYIIKSNRETGKGRCDILLEKVDKSFGYIFEFKVVDNDTDMEKESEIALNQIEDKEYYKELILDKVKDIHKVSVVFKKKECIVRSK